MGRVYRVEHVHTGEVVALKLMGHGTNAVGTADPRPIERFRREARASALIKSENVVRVLDADVSTELSAPYLVMELLDGLDLDAYLRRYGAMPRVEALAVLDATARALSRAHALGIVHRDLKPGNVFLHRVDGRVVPKLLDFGISKFESQEQERADLTADGDIVGTPMFMAPEQAAGGRLEVDGAADVWALGMIAHALLTGKAYFEGSGPRVLSSVLAGPMPAPSARSPSLSASFDAWFFRTCDRDPKGRFTSPIDAVEELGRALGVPRPWDIPFTRYRDLGVVEHAATTIHTPAEPGSKASGFAGERRQVTTLFARIVVRSTSDEEVDPEDIRDALHVFQLAVADLLGSVGNPLNRLMGDGVVVYFGVPRAFGDDAQRAVRTALALVERVQALSRRKQKESGIAVRCHVGVHTGLVVVEGTDAASGARSPGSSPAATLSVVGTAPEVAQSIGRSADPDTVVVSAATQKLVARHFRSVSLVRRELDGGLTTDLFRVDAEERSVAAGRPLSVLEGRDGELAILTQRWEQVTGGDGQVALVTGEAGIGKSRLLAALRDALAPEGVEWLEVGCSPYFQSTALYPLAQLARARAGLSHELAPAEQTEQFCRYLAPQNVGDEAESLLLALLGLPPRPGAPPLNLTPHRQKQKTIDVLLGLFASLARRRPTVFVLDDVHWVDPSTREFMDLLVARAPALGMLAIFTARPEFRHDWGLPSHLAHVPLGRLPRRRVEAMAKAIAGRPLSGALVDQLVKRTDGIPLFIEELLRAVLESGALVVRDDRYELGDVATTHAIPSSLRDSLTARLDVLGEDRAVVQWASLFGRAFTLPELVAVSGVAGEELAPILARVVALDILQERGLAPTVSYTFKHALVREAAYDSLLKPARRQGHARVAEVLLSLDPSLGDREPEVLAHHYAAAGLEVPAAWSCLKAGYKALGASAYVEALSHLERGLALAAEIPDDVLRAEVSVALQSTMGVPLMFTRGYGAVEVEQANAKALELAKASGQKKGLVPVLWGLWIFYHVRAHYRTAYDLSGQLLALTGETETEAADAGDRLCAELARGSTCVLTGRLEESRPRLERAVALFDPALHGHHANVFGQDSGMFAHAMLGWSLSHVGDLEGALAQAERSIDLARPLSHPNTLAFALGMSLATHHFRGDRELGTRRADELVSLCQEQGLPHWLALGVIHRGYWRFRRGDAAGGIDEMREGQRQWALVGARVCNSHWNLLLLEALVAERRWDEALTLLGETDAFVEESDERYFVPELVRVRGEIAAGRGDTAAARTLFEQSLAMAQAHGDLTLAARAKASLARLP
jgi:TOMM system kinase/cyclase fusion protein